MLSAGQWAAEGLLLAALLLVLVRPAAVALGLAAERMPARQLALIAWFGIRGVGSLYYLAYAVNQGLDPDLVARVEPLVLTAVAVSIVVHGISATPLMTRYQRVPS
jgi:NhaP-type Na+/H+ or K+/H+ antiporter